MKALILNNRLVLGGVVSTPSLTIHTNIKPLPTYSGNINTPDNKPTQLGTATSDKDVTSYIRVSGGIKGDPGNGIKSVELIKTEGLYKTYRILFDDGSFHDFIVTDGEQGELGETGETGNGILNIELISIIGNVKTFRINFTNGEHFDYQLQDGEILLLQSDWIDMNESNVSYIKNKPFVYIGDGLKVNEYDYLLADVSTTMTLGDNRPISSDAVYNIVGDIRDRLWRI